jgi:glycosyltransferase involved in cell wall biosynthesis
MRIAVHGFAADGVGSGAGAFPVLMASLLEAGHEVHFYGVRGFTEPRSLERFAGYRFVHFKVPSVDRLFRRARRATNRYVRAAESTASHLAYHRAVIRRMEQETPAYDVVLCVDALNLWPSRLPVLSWPQSPPQTEWAAFRDPKVSRSVRRSEGAPYFAAVHAYRAYRWLHSRLAMPFSDLIVCGSPWARDEWVRFGLAPERAAVLPYPIDVDWLASPSETPSPEATTTFLWLGRAVPRKRLDLFLEAFALVRQRHPEARARLVGALGQDPASAPLLARFRDDPSVSISGPVGREQIPALLASIDVLVQPSLNENFGFSVAEAFAAGRPVVLGPSNGTASYGGAGVFMFSEYEPAAVASAMERAAAARRAEPAALAARTREAAKNHLEPARVARGLSLLVEQTLARRASLTR